MVASPGPFTTQPKIETVKGFLIEANLSSIVLTVFITSNCCLAQDGHEIIFSKENLKNDGYKIFYD